MCSQNFVLIQKGFDQKTVFYRVLHKKSLAFGSTFFMSHPAKNRFPISTFPYLNTIWRTNSYFFTWMCKKCISRTFLHRVGKRNPDSIMRILLVLNFFLACILKLTKFWLRRRIWITLLRNKKFMLDEMPQRNSSKGQQRLFSFALWKVQFLCYQRYGQMVKI